MDDGLTSVASREALDAISDFQAIDLQAAFIARATTTASELLAILSDKIEHQPDPVTARLDDSPSPLRQGEGAEGERA
ncbi:MAG: hypothetical protein C5B50_27825 [Verrucomicrobia bacterium]|nr:MAG: hypothetical protein C5B50_27825 [Verrucomicrobiota bacterium]